MRGGGVVTPRRAPLREGKPDKPGKEFNLLQPGRARVSSWGTPWYHASLADPSAGGESATQGEEAGAVVTDSYSSQCFLAWGLSFGLCVSCVSRVGRTELTKSTSTPIKAQTSRCDLAASVYKMVSGPAHNSSKLLFFRPRDFPGSGPLVVSSAASVCVGNLSSRGPNVSKRS